MLVCCLSLSSSTHLQYLAAARIQVNGDPRPVNPGLIQRFKIINRAIPEATSSNLFESRWCQTRPPVSVLSEAVPGRLTAVCCRVCVRIRVFFSTEWMWVRRLHKRSESEIHNMWKCFQHSVKSLSLISARGLNRLLSLILFCFNISILIHICFTV